MSAAQPPAAATHDVELDGSWAIAGKIHGGYLLRLMAAAALDETHPDPLAVTAHFMSSPDPGPASVRVDALRRGRRVSTSRVQLSSDGQVRVEGHVTSGTLATASAPTFARSHGLSLPDPLDCPRAPAEGPANPFRIGHLDHVEVRWDPDCLGWLAGEPSGRADFRAWVRRDDQRELDPLDLLVAADAMAPTTYDVGIAGWVPTLELSVLVRARPAPGWLLVRQHSELIADGWLDESCDIWDGSGRLVAQARQLAAYRES